MKRTLLVWTLTLVMTAPSYALQCNTELVYEGDYRQQVAAKCGEPTFRSMNTWAYKHDDGMTYTIKFSHDKVEYIDHTRGY